jgi:hypothetical protein
MRAELMSDRLLDAERQRDDVVQKLDSYKRAAGRAEKEWELERNNLHVRTTPGSGYAARSLHVYHHMLVLQAFSGNICS